MSDTQACRFCGGNIDRKAEPDLAALTTERRAIAKALAGGPLTPSQQMALSAHVRGEKPHGGHSCPRDCPLVAVAIRVRG